MNANNPQQPTAVAAVFPLKPKKKLFICLPLWGFCVTFAASAFGSSVSNPHKGPSA